MRFYLNDYIKTLGSTAQDRVSYILEASKLEKAKLDLLARKLDDSGQFSNLVLPPEETNSLIKAGRFISDFVSVDSEMTEMYQVSNLISLLLDSHAAVLTSDIKVLDDELTALEKAISNYAFLLADTKAYDYAYLESFNDNRGRDTLPFSVPDRSGIAFTALEEAAVISDEGVITIGEAAQNSWPMTAKVLNVNAGDYATSDTDISNTTNNNAGRGWRLAVSSPQPIDSGISDPDFAGYDRAGLQAILEYSLESPSPVDNIVVEPLSDASVTVLQIRVYNDMEETKFFDLLDVNEVGDNSSNNSTKKTTSFHFPLQSVAKFKILLQAKTYQKLDLTSIEEENTYRRISNAIDSARSNDSDNTTGKGSYDPNASAAQREAILARRKLQWERDIKSPNSKFNSAYQANAPRYKDEKSLWGAIAKRNSALEGNSYEADDNVWSNNTLWSSVFSNALMEIVDTNDLQQLLKSRYRTHRSRNNSQYRSFSDDPNIQPQVPPGQSTVDFTRLVGSTTYEYTLGLKAVRATANAQSFRAVFVSRQVPSPGDCGEVKLKAEDLNFYHTNTTRDSAKATSVEYSVTNLANPSKETDWLPILPPNVTAVTAERFFVDDAGKGFFRFPASLQGDIVLYKNGYAFEPVPQKDMQLRSMNRQSIIGMRLPTASYTQSDIFTVDYVPSYDVSVVNFEDQLGVPFSSPPLVSSYDEDGAGEGFLNTNGQLSVSLSAKPYVDYSHIAEADYVANYGLSGSYNPVVVRFDDGTVAYNLTNYQGGEQSALNADSGTVQFVHNGNELLFNKALSSAFRVYYQYLPSNVRVRVILRCNDKDFVSPKADYFQLKAKTRKSDVRKDT